MCIYAEITKSGRFRCIHDIEKNEGEEKSSPSFSNSNSKSCPYQKYCQKTFEWIHINQNKCKFYQEQ